LKRDLTPLSNELAVHVCRGRGKHSRQTPQELVAIGERVGFDGAALGSSPRSTVPLCRMASISICTADYLLPSRLHDSLQRQYAHIVDSWVEEIGLDPADYGTHSMRRTKASVIYRRTKNLRAVQLLLGHTKLESTVRYLGIEVDDALELAEQTEV
jgi:integrase